jgi:hypothetical protein
MIQFSAPIRKVDTENMRETKETLNRLSDQIQLTQRIRDVIYQVEPEPDQSADTAARRSTEKEREVSESMDKALIELMRGIDESVFWPRDREREVSGSMDKPLIEFLARSEMSIQRVRE